VTEVWVRRPFRFTGADGEVICGHQRVHDVPDEVARHAEYRGLALAAADAQAVRERERLEEFWAEHGNGPPAVFADDAFDLGAIPCPTS